MTTTKIRQTSIIRLAKAKGDRPFKGQWNHFFSGRGWFQFVRCPTCGNLSTLLMYTVNAKGRVSPRWKCGRNFGTHVCRAEGKLHLEGWTSKTKKRGTP